jgi:hypothetical protein
MWYTWMLILVVLGAAPSVDVVQGGKGACTLLTAAELSQAVGMTVGEGAPNETVIPSGLAKGQTMRGCQWRAGEKGMVSVNMIKAPNAEQRAAGMARMNQVYEKLKAQGWTQKRETFGGSITCSTLTPPTNDGSTPSMSGCMGEAKGQGIGVGFMYPGTTLPMAKVKSLFDKASSRIG